MVKNMGYIDNFTGKVWDWTKPFQRTGKFPLDRSSMFASYEDALLYAKGDGSDSRGLGATSYIGQTITVWGPNDKGVDGVWVYSLVPTEKEGFASELKAVGSTQTETATTYSVAKELSKDLVVGQLILVASEETIGEGDQKQTYKAGFYIVNAPGTISALDTSTGASDEIGALSNRVAAVEGKVTELEGNRVLNSVFEAYQGQVTEELGGKVATGDFTSYQLEVSTALGEKATTEALGKLEETVNKDIDALTTLIDDYSGTLGDVDDRLGELEAFVEAHESIPTSDIEGLFGESEE